MLTGLVKLCKNHKLQNMIHMLILMLKTFRIAFFDAFLRFRIQICVSNDCQLCVNFMSTATELNADLTSLDSRSFTRSTYRQWDANNLTEQGVYHVALTSHGPTSSTTYGVMLVIKIGTYGAQFFVTGTTTFARYRNDGSWLNWQPLN